MMAKFMIKALADSIVWLELHLPEGKKRCAFPYRRQKASELTAACVMTFLRPFMPFMREEPSLFNHS